MGKRLVVEEPKDDDDEVGEDVWTVEDYAAAISARLKPVFHLIDRFLEAGQKIFRALWPDVHPPKRTSGILKKMTEAPERAAEWKESVARQACKFTLDVFLSWHSNVDLGRFTSLRKRKPDEVPEHSEEDVLARACALANYVPVDDYLDAPPIEGAETPVAASDRSEKSGASGSSAEADDVEGSGSSAEDDAEDDEEESEEDADSDYQASQ